jgi:hypothetical protein
MGTNYYIVEPLTVNNKHLPLWFNRNHMHMGKSSFGWTFTFHANGSLKTWHDHKVFYKYLIDTGWKIFDEYGAEQSWREFLELVDSKKNARTIKPRIIRVRTLGLTAKEILFPLESSHNNLTVPPRYATMEA